MDLRHCTYRNTSWASWHLDICDPVNHSRRNLTAFGISDSTRRMAVSVGNNDNTVYSTIRSELHGHITSTSTDNYMTLWDICFCLACSERKWSHHVTKGDWWAEPSEGIAYSVKSSHCAASRVRWDTTVHYWCTLHVCEIWLTTVCLYNPQTTMTKKHILDAYAVRSSAAIAEKPCSTPFGNLGVGHCQTTNVYAVSGKKETKMFYFVISSLKLRQFWWNLLHTFLDKFAAKSCKRFSPCLNIGSKLPYRTLNAHCTHATIELLEKEIPELVQSQHLPPDLPDLNAVDYSVWGISHIIHHKHFNSTWLRILKRLLARWNAVMSSLLWRSMVSVTLLPHTNHSFLHLGWPWTLEAGVIARSQCWGQPARHSPVHQDPGVC